MLLDHHRDRAALRCSAVRAERLIKIRVRRNFVILTMLSLPKAVGLLTPTFRS